MQPEQKEGMFPSDLDGGNWWEGKCEDKPFIQKTMQHPDIVLFFFKNVL